MFLSYDAWQRGTLTGGSVGGELETFGPGFVGRADFGKDGDVEVAELGGDVFR